MVHPVDAYFLVNISPIMTKILDFMIQFFLFIFLEMK